MIAGGVRKARQFIADPTLRRWFLGRALGRYHNPAEFTPHVPPYASTMLPLSQEALKPHIQFDSLTTALPTTSLTLDLPGETVTVSHAAIDNLFDRTFSDIETQLAVHRFQWVCAQGDQVDPEWVAAIWQAWCVRFSSPIDSWAWHPYTATERAVNILRFFRRFGLPDIAKDTLHILAAHGPAIASKLEYFGDHNSSNHLANNGRGLFILGLELGLSECMALGAEILHHEAKRSFRVSGILREQSSHYQGLLSCHYMECAQLAERYKSEHAPAFRDIADRAYGALAYLMLPGGMPLVGDISPDLSPKTLLSRLDAAETEMQDLSSDGWLRMHSEDWSGLWHCSPDGWSHMPGHGHQDCGSFELHFGNERVFIDPGRGAYGEEGEAAFYRSTDVHNGLSVDGADPYPANKPYYSSQFRSDECGPVPTLTRTDDGVLLEHHGYSRLGDVGSVQRQWHFHAQGLRIKDTVQGSGNHQLRRALVTPLSCQHDEDAIILTGKNVSYRISSDVEIMLKPIKIWTAYGVADDGIQIVFQTQTSLPWIGEIIVQVMR